MYEDWRRRHGNVRKMHENSDGGCLYRIDQFQLSTDLNAFLDYFDQPFDI